MAIIQPIKGIRPTRDKIHLVASRAVNTYSVRLLNAKLEENPFTFLHVILPEFGKKANTKPNTIERFKLVKKKFDEFQKKGIFITEKSPAFYIYRQIRKGYSYTGIIAGSAVSDYINGEVKIHEQTLKKRQEIFTDYLDTCEFNAEPVLLCYDEIPEVEKLISFYTKYRAEYEFTTSDTISHYVWVITKKDDIKKIKNYFSKLDAVYIADGHHRFASSEALAQRRNSKLNGKMPYDFCLSYFISSKQLRILEFNRLIKDTGKLTQSQILSKIKENYSIKLTGSERAKPSREGEMGMYMNGVWYLLTINENLRKSGNAADKLDASLLTKHILAPIFSIKDLTHNSRISFAGGNMGPDYLEKMVNKGDAAIAFYLYPISFKALKAVADGKLIMPPKSTYILPKLRSGLIIQSIK